MTNRQCNPRLTQLRSQRPIPRQPRVFRNWVAESPRLKAALAEAARRFGDLPGVYGVGLGRKYCESSKQGGAKPRSTMGLCVAILVKEKIDGARLQRNERIPKYLSVVVAGQKVRVLTDVVVVGDSDVCGKEDGEESGDNWPVVGDVRPGARHSCSINGVEADSGRFGEGEAMLGTTGAIIAVGTDQYGTTAAHTVIAVSEGKDSVPSYPRGFGVRGQEWICLQPSAFFPGSIRVGPCINDALLFLIPAGLAATGEGVWPSGFEGRFATGDDITAAIHANELGCFVWVERSGKRIKRSCSLWQGSESFRRRTPGGLLQYSFVWMYRFQSANEQHTTKGGDSGAGIFIPAADNGGECRLLGFHFFHNGDVAYAVDAENFLRLNAGEPGADFKFAALEEA